MSTDAQPSTFTSAQNAPASDAPSSGVRCGDAAAAKRTPAEPGPMTTRSGRGLGNLLDIAIAGFGVQWAEDKDGNGSRDERTAAFLRSTADELEMLHAAMSSEEWLGDEIAVQERILLVAGKLRAFDDLLVHLKRAGR